MHAPVSGENGHVRWAVKGMAGIFTAPALILMMSTTGFAALARDSGLDWIETTFSTVVIWALPAQIILVGAATAGASLPAALLAVALSSVRLMPMVIALVPELRGPNTRRSTLFFLSHFVAITAWVFAMERVSQIPRPYRTSFFAGFAVTLTSANTIIVALAFNLMGQLSTLAMGALAFLTPVYFLISLFGSAREVSGRIGLLTGMVLIPPAKWLFPQVDILVAGILGGLIAFALGRLIERRRPE